MELLVRNAEGNVSERDREYAAQKLGRLDRYFHQAHKVEMVHREDKLGHRLEITVFADHFTIRGEESDLDLRAAIDKVSEKIEARLRRLKGRLVKNHRRKGNSVPKGLIDEVSASEEEESHIEIKERKHFLLKPMSRDEAALQMEMVDHPFFLFRSEETGQVELLYKRKDGKFGLIQPEL